jgi:hypothetical protein
VPALVTSATAHLFGVTEGLLGAEGDDPLVIKAVEMIGGHTIRSGE